MHKSAGSEEGTSEKVIFLLHLKNHEELVLEGQGWEHQAVDTAHTKVLRKNGAWWVWGNERGVLQESGEPMLRGSGYETRQSADIWATRWNCWTDLGVRGVLSQTHKPGWVTENMHG